MPTLASGMAFLAAAHRTQHFIEKVRWSWEHHDTLWYLALGLVLLFGTWVGHRREWNEVVLVLMGIAGIGAVCAAAAMGVLGDWARHTGPVSARTVAREIRASQGGPISDVPLGEVCKNGYDCNRSAACVQLDGDSFKRCQARCGKYDQCDDGASCKKVRGTKVCIAE